MDPVHPLSRPLARYGVAVLAVAVVIVLKSAITAVAGVETPFMLLLAAVLVAAWYGGIGPGLVATGLATGAVAAGILTPGHPYHAAPYDHDLRLLQFLAEGMFVSVLTGLHRTSRDQAHRRLEELRVTLLGIGEAVLATDATGRVRLLNPVAQTLVGRRPGDAAGRPLDEILTLVDDETGKRAVCPARRALQGELVRGEEHRCTRPDGTAVWLRANAAPTHDRRGRLTGAVLVLADVTCEKEAERALRRSHAALQSRLSTIAEDERRRISRELHDETGQQLTALCLGLKRARERVADPGLAADLGTLQTQAGEIGRALHRIAWELRPAVLDDVGPGPALRDAAGRWAERAAARIEFHSTLGARRFHPDVETHLYRIVTEAVTNAIRHAGATRIGVVLDGPPDELRAVVEDDGRGFDPEATARTNRLGLYGMSERAALVGGSVQIESDPGHGTTVFVRLPLTAPPGAHS